MPDNQSKRRRQSSFSTNKLTNVGPQTSERQDPAQAASPSSRGNLERYSENPWGSSVPHEFSMGGHQNPEGKMLLLPLPRPMASISRASERNRTTHACDLCRKAKAKCTGGQPCQKCKNESKECIYGDGKRDKERKILERTTKQNESLRAQAEALRSGLREVGESSNLSKLEYSKISELLAKSPTNFSADDEEYASVGSQPNFYQLQQQHGESEAAGDVGSTGSLDAVDVDTTHDVQARSTGFLGKSSSVRWIQRAEKEVYDGSDAERMRSDLALYHTGDPDFYEFIHQEFSSSWKYELPPLETATKLVDSYFMHVHPDFSILSRDEFMRNFKKCTEKREKDFSDVDHIILCQINCVFAISSTFTHLVATERGQNGYRDHLLYYARTRALGLEKQPYGALASLDYICSLGLLALYLVANYYVNRAWNTIGVAVRNAVTLGLHIRSEASQLSELEKELRNRIWWSLFSLEHLMNEITGRPSCINYRDISTPHPIHFNEDEVNETSARRTNTKRRKSSENPRGKGKATEPQRSRQILGISKLARTPLFTSLSTTTYFSHRIALNVLTHEILNRLFCAAVVDMKWNTIQDIIREIDGRLQQWRGSLPDELQFPFNGNEEEDDNWRERKGLAMTYHTARMILHRPALCRMDGRIQNESSESQQFNRDAVANCVESARGSIETIGPPDDPTEIYLIQPWWEVLHHLCQAASILMLEISFCASHIPQEVSEILQDAKNAVHWLRAMSRQSIPSYKAWQTHDRTLRLVATKINADLSDMPTEAEVPPGWQSPSMRYPTTSYRDEHISDSNQNLTQQQSQNLAATSAWVQRAFVQSAAAHPETNYMTTEFPDQPNYFQPGFQPNLWDPFTNFDSPGFPWYPEQANYLGDQSQEMQGVTNMDQYQPYSTGLTPTGQGMGGQNPGDTGHISQLDESMNQSGEHNYQDVNESYPTEGSYSQQQWHSRGGDSRGAGS